MPRASLLLLCLGLTACQLVRSDPDKATRSYPFWLKQGETLSMQAITEGETLLLVNATTREFSDVDVWVNQRYMQHVDHIAPGENKRLRLDAFWDVRGEGPNPGGALRYYKPTPVRLVQLQVDATSPLVGLEAVLTEDETR